MTAYCTVPYAVICCKLKQNANEGFNSCASLAGLILCFIAYFILLVISPLTIQRALLAWWGWLNVEIWTRKVQNLRRTIDDNDNGSR